MQNCNDLIDHICLKYHFAIFVGDFNLPFLTENVNIAPYNKFSTLIDKIIEFGLQQLVNEPTRGHNILDIVFCTKFVSYENVLVSPPFASSDHCSQEININVLCDENINLGDVSTTANFILISLTFICIVLIGIVSWLTLMMLIPYGIDLCVINYGINLFVYVVKRYVLNSCKIIYPPYILKLQAMKRKLLRIRHRDGMNAYLNISSQYMKAVKRFHTRTETRLLNLSSKSCYNYINKKLKLKSVISAILDDTGSICIRDIEKANGFMYVWKCLL